MGGPGLQCAPAREAYAQGPALCLSLLLQSKAWTAVVLLSLAVGIGGGTTTLFSAVNALLLRTIPAHDPNQLVRLMTRRGR